MTETDSKTSETSKEEVAPVESQATVSSNQPQVEAVPVAATVTVTEPAPEPAEKTAEADTVAGEVAAVETHADTVSGESAPETGEESSAGSVAAEGAGKKKRRRRRKKGGQAGASESPSDPKSAHHHAPFLHLFSGGAARKHAFSAGEEIAGRVERVEHGTVIIDVFGKATAIANVDEPRDIAHAEPVVDPILAITQASEATELPRRTFRFTRQWFRRSRRLRRLSCKRQPLRWPSWHKATHRAGSFSPPK